MTVYSSFAAGFQYFLWVFAAGFLLGAIRVPFVVPLIGERWAELAEMPIMLLAIVYAARRVCRVHALAKLGPSLACGFSALLLLLLAEATMVVVVRKQTLTAYLDSRDPVSGTVYAMMLLVYAAMPIWLWKQSTSRSS